MPKQRSWLTALAGGSCLAGILCCALPLGLLVWIGSNVDTAQFNQGQIVFLTASTANAPCVDIYKIAGGTTVLAQRPVGSRLTIQSRTRLTDAQNTWWYQIQEQGAALGWVPESSLSDSAVEAAPASACQ
jgi:hypothetical protein